MVGFKPTSLLSFVMFSSHYKSRSRKITICVVNVCRMWHSMKDYVPLRGWGLGFLWQPCMSLHSEKLDKLEEVVGKLYPSMCDVIYWRPQFEASNFYPTTRLDKTVTGRPNMEQWIMMEMGDRKLFFSLIRKPVWQEK